MANDISSKARALARRVFRPDSKAAAGMTALITAQERKGDGRNIAAYAQLLQELLDKGIQGYSVITLDYRAPVHTHNGRHAGKCSLCSATLKHGHILSVRGTKNDKVANKASTAYEILVGNDHLDHLQQVVGAIEDKDFGAFLKEVREVQGHASGNRHSLEALAGGLGVDEAQLATLRYVQKFVGNIYSPDASTIAAVQSVGIEKTSSAWLEQQIKADKMPDAVVQAYERYEGGWYTREHAATLDKAVKEGMLLPSGGLIPDLAAEVKYLADSTCRVSAERKERILAAADEEFKPRALIDIVHDFKRQEGQTVGEKIKDSFMTYSDMLALRQQLAGLKAARQEHNSATLDRYCSGTGSGRFDAIWTVAKGLVERQKATLAAWHKKHPKEDVETENADADNGNGRKWIMAPAEYRIIRDVISLLDDAGSTTPREDLVRLLPMPVAQKIFGTLYLVEAKERLHIKQTDKYVPAVDLPIDMHRLTTTALSRDAKTCLPEQKQACRSNALGVTRAAGLQMRLDNDELIPASIGTRNLVKSDVERLNAIVSEAVPVTPELRKTIDYIDGLASSALELGFIGLLTNGMQRVGVQPTFDIKLYTGAGFVFKDQAAAIQRVMQEIVKAKLDNIDLAAFAKGTSALLQRPDARIYVANMGPGAGHVGLMQYQDKPACRDSIYWQPFSYKRGVVEAASAMTAKQEPTLFAELMKIQSQDRDAMEELAQGKARASSRVIDEAHKIVDGVKQGAIKCDPLLAVREDQRMQYLDGRWFDVHADSAAANDALGEIIATFGKPKPGHSRDHLGTLHFQPDTRRFEAHGLDKQRLSALLESVATRNYQTGRQVYVFIDVARGTKA